MKRKYKIDSNIYISIRWFCFIGSSALSALLNIILFRALDASSIWLMTGFSLTLELAKLVTVISMNVWGDLYEKLLVTKIKRLQILTICMYFVYALLSISASLGFSTMVTSRTEATTNLEFDSLKANVVEIEKQQEAITDIKNIISLSQSEYIAEYEQKYQTADANYRDADLARSTALSARQRLGARSDENAEEWDKLNNEFVAADTLRQTLDRARSEALRNKTTISNEYDQRKRDAQDNLDSANQEMVLMLKNAKIENTQYPAAAITELNIRLKDMEAKHIRELGMQYVFQTWAALFGITPQQIKFIILVIISLLLELTVFQTAPDIKVSRGVLFFFRFGLPKDTDIRQLLAMYDEEYEKFDDPVIIETPLAPLPIPEKPPRKKRAKRIKEPEIVIEAPEQQIPEVIEKSTEIIEPVIEKELEQEEIIDIEPEEEPIIDSSITVYPKPEVLKAPISRIQNSYMFGSATEEIKNKLVEFVNACIGSPGAFNKHPDEAANLIKLNNRAKEVFLNRLSSLTLGEKHLIYKNKYEEWFSNFEAQIIIDFATSIKQ